MYTTTVHMVHNSMEPKGFLNDCTLCISEEKKLNVADVTEMHMCVLMYSREFWIYYYLQ